MALTDDRKHGDYLLHREGSAYWIAEAPCYKDPQMSPVGYGNTPQEAVDELIRQPQFQEFLKRSSAPPPSLCHFKIDPRPAAGYYPDAKSCPVGGALDYHRLRLVRLF